ncbi:MAG TPA: hypothetical protein VFZ97_13400 [Acidimicrobiales bacterium]
MSQPGSRPFVDAVQAGGSGLPWLIGGVVATPQQVHPEGLVTSDELREVAIWESTSPSGPWKVAPMKPVPGRDGPNETILYFAGTGQSPVAFGSRASPTEGYPRPSAWTSSPSGWTEDLESRELFGGPNIVGFGGMGEGPHGYFIAGTWSDSRGHAQASVWTSPTGTGWIRVNDPSFEGHRGETPIGEAIADTRQGVLLAATVEAPTRQDPSAQHIGLWYSPRGRQWARLGARQLGMSHSTAGAIISVGGGWLVAGTTTAGGRSRPAVWLVDSSLRVAKATVLPGTLPIGGTLDPVTTITTAAAYGSRVVVAGVARGVPVIWTAHLGRRGVPTAWRREHAPSASPPSLQRVSVALGARATVVVLTGKTDSALWYAWSKGSRVPEGG